MYLNGLWRLMIIRTGLTVGSNFNGTDLLSSAASRNVNKPTSSFSEVGSRTQMFIK